MSNPIGVNTWTWVSPFRDADAAVLFPKIKSMGFDIVEIALEDPSHATAAVIKEQLDANGLKATVCGAFGPSRDLASEESAVVNEALMYIRQTVEFAAGVGATVVAGPMYSAVGKARQVPPEQREEEFQRSAMNLRTAAGIAKDNGITLALEPLNRFETDMINTSAQVRRLVDTIDHPNAKIHLDTFHMNIEEDNVLDAIKLAGKDLAHVHASESNRGTPGNGLARWDDLAAGIKAVGYTGPVVIETFTPAVKEIARAAAIWRQLAPSQDQLASDGLAFLRKLLA
ncbi:MAG: sugar phosphate isomerase/epimerase family protein [Chthonomonadales bacterium]